MSNQPAGIPPGDCKPAKKRAVDLDVARGALMAWIVVVIHGMFWLRLVPQPIASFALFEMPLIFMIAGGAYFLSTPKARGGPTAPAPGAYLDYVVRRCARILVPYFAYALVCAVIVLAIGGEAPSFQNASSAIAAWLNPINGGAGHTMLMLNWHLWFVAPFLIIAALMPLLTPQRIAIGAPLWILAAGAAVFVFVSDRLDTSQIGAVQIIVFYAIWTAFGFALAAAPARFSVRDYALVLALSISALAALLALFPEQVSLNMQTNKFPPNGVFFLFCCAWVSLILILVKLMKLSAAATALADQPLLQPFMRAGYSIYLWQGLGYSAAALIGRHFAWQPIMIWPLAVVLSVALGCLAAPLERINLNRNWWSQAGSNR